MTCITFDADIQEVTFDAVIDTITVSVECVFELVTISNLIDNEGNNLIDNEGNQLVA